jgi:predicted DNA-binding transcriptional regulator YafY
VSRKGQSITLSISDQDKAALEALALELGMMWGERPNISKLVEAIARRELLIGYNHDWSESRVKALVQAISALTDTGQSENAQTVARLLSERSELSIPLRKEIERFLETPPIPWRLDIERYIRQQQPFQLSYRDATERAWTFTIRHAQIAFHERRQYLDCWCEETEGNQDIPELMHNWCLRLDRIPEAAIIPIEGNWRSGLDTVEIEMHLFGGLAFAYQAKTEDILNEWIPNRPQVRRILKRVSQTFWLTREILAYGPDCVILSPPSLRQRIQEKLMEAQNRYQEA